MIQQKIDDLKQELKHNANLMLPSLNMNIRTESQKQVGLKKITPIRKEISNVSVIKKLHSMGTQGSTTANGKQHIFNENTSQTNKHKQQSVQKMYFQQDFNSIATQQNLPVYKEKKSKKVIDKKSIEDEQEDQEKENKEDNIDEKDEKEKKKQIMKYNVKPLSVNTRQSQNRVGTVKTTVPNSVLRIKDNNYIHRKKEKNILQNYKLKEIIGRGSFGKVRLAGKYIQHILIKYINKTNINNKQHTYYCLIVELDSDKQETSSLVAIKIYEKIKLVDQVKRQIVKREIETLRRLSHPSIIKMIKQIDNRDTLNIVMEYGGRVTVKEHLSVLKLKNSKLYESQAKSMFKQMVRAIEYLHDQSIVHLDLKLENILFLEGDMVKLIDFGFSRENKANQKLDFICGTPNYMSPELLAKKSYLGQPADIWALGIILFLLLRSEFPYKGSNEQDLLKNIIDNKMYDKGNMTAPAEELLMMILRKNQLQRPTCQQILEHPWLNS